TPGRDLLRERGHVPVLGQAPAREAHDVALFRLHLLSVLPGILHHDTRLSSWISLWARSMETSRLGGLMLPARWPASMQTRSYLSAPLVIGIARMGASCPSRRHRS